MYYFQTFGAEIENRIEFYQGMYIWRFIQLQSSTALEGCMSISIRMKNKASGSLFEVWRGS